MNASETEDNIQRDNGSWEPAAFSLTPYALSIVSTLDFVAFNAYGVYFAFEDLHEQTTDQNPRWTRKNGISDPWSFQDNIQGNIDSLLYCIQKAPSINQRLWICETGWSSDASRLETDANTRAYEVDGGWSTLAHQKVFYGGFMDFQVPYKLDVHANKTTPTLERMFYLHIARLGQAGER